MTAPLKTPLSSSWSLQMTPQSSASSRTETRRSWLSGAVTTTWSSTRSKLWRWSWTSGETPVLLSLTIMNSTVAAVESFRFLGVWSGTLTSTQAQQRLCFLGQLKKFNLPPARMTVLLRCYWVGSVLLYNCLVWVSQQIRYKTAGDCKDSRKKHWCAPAQPTVLVLLQRAESGRWHHHRPLSPRTRPVCTSPLRQTLQISVHKNI